MIEEKRITPFTIKEFSELAERRRDEWSRDRFQAYQNDPTGVYPLHPFEHASDQSYHPGPPSIKINYHYYNEEAVRSG